MKPFTYQRAPASGDAVALPAGGMFLAGGTTVVDLLRLEVLQPTALVDLAPMGQLATIAETPGGGLLIGARATNAATAYHPVVAQKFGVLAEAILAGASPQIRNMATAGGNLLQRTRCPYYRDVAVAQCNKRAPGSGCAAIGGVARTHAIFGTSDRCIAAHPSDMCVALLALDAVVHVRGAGGTGATRQVPIAEFHTLPGEHPEIESVLAHGELVTGIEIPPESARLRARYVKVRDRAAFEFALASAAAAIELHGKTIARARVALGGVGTKPWRADAVEALLVGQPNAPATFAKAAQALAETGARLAPDNRFKLDLARRAIARALALAGGVA